MEKQKSSIFNLDANIVVLIAYLGGLICKWLHVVCYFAWVIPLIIYLIESKNEFVKRQSAQATLLYLVSSILSLLVLIFLKIFAPSESADIYNMIITGSLFLVGIISLLATLVAVAITIFAIVAAVKTYNYEDYNIPYLSRYLDKFISYLEILEGKTHKPKEENTCNCEECHCNKSYKKVKPHKIRKKETKVSKEEPKKTLQGRTRI